MIVDYLKICKVRCQQCGDDVQFISYIKNGKQGYFGKENLYFCSCGKIGLEINNNAYKIIGNSEDYEEVVKEQEGEIHINLINFPEEMEGSKMKYEIWLDDSYAYFNRGVAHLEKDQIVPLKAYVHNATLGPDSVLIGEADNFQFPPVRYFLRSTMLDFYKINKDTPIVLLHNESSTDFQIGTFGTLPAGESAEIDLFNKTLQFS